MVNYTYCAGGKSTIEPMKLKHGTVFETLLTDMESWQGMDLVTSVKEHGEVLRKCYSLFLVALSEHLNSRSPDTALLNAFGIFDPSVMEDTHPV